MMSAVFLFIVFLLVLVFPDSAFAALDNKTFLTKLVGSFKDETTRWTPVLRKYTLWLFKWLLTFEIAWMGIKLALGQEQIHAALKQFVMLLVVSGFFMACIMNYQEWMPTLQKGLQAIAVELGAPDTQTQGPFAAGLSVIEKILKKMSGWSPIDALGLLIAALVVLICFALITARVVLIKCEVVVAMAACMILMGCGATSLVRDYAVNALKYIIATAFKLFVMQLIIAVGVGVIVDFAAKTSTEWQDLFVVIGASVVLLALINTLPETCAGIISGSNLGGSSGVGLGAAAAAVGGAAVGAVGGAMAAGSATRSASKIADLAGATGLGKVGHMAMNLMSAGGEAKAQRSTRSGIMAERLEAAKQKNKGNA